MPTNSNSQPGITPVRLILCSTKTPPAIPSALSQNLAILALLVISVQAVPVSFFH
jgi:hypothetical protein